MAEAARYLFDRSFDGASNASESEQEIAIRLLREEWEGKLADARREAFEEGVAETQKSIESDTREAVNALLQSAQKLLEGVERECCTIRKDAIELAATTATLLTRELTKRFPTDNLESLISEALEHIGDAPHIALSVNDAHAESIQKAVTKITTERGYSGKIIVLGDPETKVGDCSLQWADGGILLDQDKTRSAIDKLVKHHLDRLHCDPAPQQEPTETPDQPLTGGQSETNFESGTTAGSGELK